MPIPTPPVVHGKIIAAEFSAKLIVVNAVL